MLAGGALGMAYNNAAGLLQHSYIAQWLSSHSPLRKSLVTAQAVPTFVSRGAWHQQPPMLKLYQVMAHKKSVPWISTLLPSDLLPVRRTADLQVIS